MCAESEARASSTAAAPSAPPATSKTQTGRVRKRRRRPPPALQFVFYGAMFFLFASAAAVTPAYPTPLSAWVLLANFLLTFPALWVALALHESAHAIAARSLGMGVPCIYVGEGARPWSTAVGRTTLVLRPWPLSGLTLVTSPTKRLLRTRFRLTLLAGPASHVAVIWLLVHVAGSAIAITELGNRVQVLTAFVYANGLLLLTSALPLRVAYGDGREE